MTREQAQKIAEAVHKLAQYEALEQIDRNSSGRDTDSFGWDAEIRRAKEALIEALAGGA